MSRCGIIIVSLFFLLFSCSDRIQNKKISGKPISLPPVKQLNWVGHWKNEGYKEQILYQVKRRFEFENQDIILNIEFPGDVYQGKPDERAVYDEVTSGSPRWDIMRINNQNEGIVNLGGESWLRENLVDFSQYELFRKNSLDYITSEEMKAKWGGIIPGHALDANSYLVWCNKEVAAKIGITPKPFEMTADDFESYIKALSEYNKKHNTSIYGINVNKNWNTEFALGFQLFASLTGDYNTLRDFSYSPEKVAAWEQVLNYTEKISSYNIVDPNWESKEWNNYFDKFLNGEYLFFVSATFLYNIFQNTDSINYKNIIPLELPAFKPAQSYIGEFSIPWVVPKNARNKEEAIRFMLYWCSEDIAQDWKKNTKGPTGIKSSLVQSGFGDDVYESYDYVINKKYNSKMISVSQYNSRNIFGEKNNAVPNHFLTVLTGQMSAREAMADIKNRLIKK